LVLAVLQGKRLVFVTNNSTKSRKQYGKKFETLGLSVDEVGFYSDCRHEPC
jgi:ribonucleotide monophosphatase NagD (HAD superfamily)